jgi:opacity protein-like surface antigen
MMRRSWMGAFGALCLLAAAPASAAVGPDHSVRLRLGLFTPAGDGDYFEGKAEDFTGEASDFEDAVGGVDYLYHGGSRFRFVLSGDSFEGQTDQEYRDFEDNFGDPILHTTTLEITSITAGVQLPLAPRGAAIQPYVGAGGGLYTYRLEESGDFIDFGRNGQIFSTTLEAEGSAFGYYLLAGLEIPVGPYFSFIAEGRWDNAEDELEDDFDDPQFGTLDLSGRRVMGGVSWSF